ncbi:MAG TPA: CBS domain-containing protein [Azospirillaceae bacterium]|nr:CBS domain-containing protein [Azospirillaceae bacterium]
MPHRNVKEMLTTRPVLTLPPEATVREAACEMRRNHIASIVVARDDHVLEGIFTERDLTDRVVASGLDPDKTSLDRVMTRHPVAIGPDSTVRDALRLMSANDVRHLPIVGNDGVTIGMLSARDFMGEEVAELEHDRAMVESLVEVL